MALRLVRKGSRMADTTSDSAIKVRNRNSSTGRQDDAGHLGREGQQAEQKEDGHLCNAGHPIEIIDEGFFIVYGGIA